MNSSPQRGEAGRGETQRGEAGRGESNRRMPAFVAVLKFSTSLPLS